MESQANLLWKEALQSLTIAHAGSDTQKFFNLLTAHFGANASGTHNNPWDFLDTVPAILPPLSLAKTDSDDEQGSVASAVTT